MFEVLVRIVLRNPVPLSYPSKLMLMSVSSNQPWNQNQSIKRLCAASNNWKRLFDLGTWRFHQIVRTSQKFIHCRVGSFADRLSIRTHLGIDYRQVKIEYHILLTGLPVEPYNQLFFLRNSGIGGNDFIVKCTDKKGKALVFCLMSYCLFGCPTIWPTNKRIGRCKSVGVA